MSNATAAPVAHADRFFIGGEWVAPVLRCDHRRDRFHDRRAVLHGRRGRARRHHAGRRGRAARVRRRAVAAPVARRSAPSTSAHWVRACSSTATSSGSCGRARPARCTRSRSTPGMIGSKALESYAALADTFPFEEECPPTNGGAFGLLVREPVGVVGAIVPWNAPVALDLPQDRPRAPRRLHRGAQVVAGGAG